MNHKILPFSVVLFDVNQHFSYALIPLETPSFLPLQLVMCNALYERMQFALFSFYDKFVQTLPQKPVSAVKNLPLGGSGSNVQFKMHQWLPVY